MTGDSGGGGGTTACGGGGAISQVSSMTPTTPPLGRPSKDITTVCGGERRQQDRSKERERTGGQRLGPPVGPIIRWSVLLSGGPCYVYPVGLMGFSVPSALVRVQHPV
ncbi:hypothetical protein Hdeb2414_s0012g00386151 [Helianthus debilis subsp. tardiflorus]